MELLLTIMLTGAVVWQAVLTALLNRVARKQADISETQVGITKETEERRRKQDSPQIRFVAISYSHSYSDGRDTEKFVGFSVTNASVRKINVDCLNLDFSIMNQGHPRGLQFQ